MAKRLVNAKHAHEPNEVVPDENVSLMKLEVGLQNRLAAGEGREGEWVNG